MLLIDSYKVMVFYYILLDGHWLINNKWQTLLQYKDHIISILLSNH